MKKIFYMPITLIFGFSMMSMTACFPKVEKNSTNSLPSLSSSVSATKEDDFSVPTNSEISDNEFSEHIVDNEVEMLNIDADVYIPNGFDISQKLSATNAKYKKWNGETIVSELINNQLISGQEVISSNSGENSGPDDMYYSYELDDNSQISLYTGGINYSSKNYMELSYSFYFDFYGNYFNNTLYNMFGKNDIDGLDKTEAKSTTDKVLSLLDLSSMVGKPEIYSMTSDKVQAIREETSATRDKYENDLRQFTEQDDAYLIIYPVEYKGIPSSQVMAMGENELIECSKVFFLYSKSGLIGFEISGIFDELEDAESSMIISPTDVCDRLKEFYSSIIVDAPINISMIKLVFINRRDYYTDDFLKCKVEPVWLIYGNQTIFKDGDKFNAEYISFINALTGETIPVLSIGG